MDISELQQLSVEHQRIFLSTLAQDAFFVPVERMEVDRTTGDMQVRYIRSVVEQASQKHVYLPLFSQKSFWDSLNLESPALVRPPLRYLRKDLGNIAVVIDLGSERSFTANLDILIAMQEHLRESG